MSRLAVYESKIHKVILGGISLDDGRSDPYFKIAPNGDAYVIEGPGADGHVAFCGTNNDVYEITLSFKGTSSCNDILSALHIADRKAFNGAGIVTLTAEDGSGSSLIMTDRCRIMGMAEQAYGITKPDTNWKLIAVIEPGGFLLGGN
jgi:hypothetical protein